MKGISRGVDKGKGRSNRKKSSNSLSHYPSIVLVESPVFGVLSCCLVGGDLVLDESVSKGQELLEVNIAGLVDIVFGEHVLEASGVDLVADGVEERVELAAGDGAVVVAVKSVEALLKIRDLCWGEFARGSLFLLPLSIDRGGTRTGVANGGGENERVS